jgi:hypothetical protein
MTGAEPLEARLADYLGAERAALESIMAQESSRALHQEFLLAESGTLPDRQARLERIRAVGARAWLRHLAAALQAEWSDAPDGMQGKLELRMARGHDRLEALELEEDAALEREGVSGDVDADRRRVTLGAYVRLFAEGVGDIATPNGRTGPEFGRQIAAIMRREDAQRRAIEKAAFEAWSGSPMEGVLETARTTAASPEPDIVRVLEAAGVWSYIRVLCMALAAALEPPTRAADGA